MTVDSDMIGKSVAGFRIVEKIGEGGMGEVYLAEDSTLHRRVALKFLTRRFMHDEEARERFIREARSAAALNHPNIVTIFGFGEFENQYYIAMELIEGVSVGQLIRGQRLEVGQIADIALQLCDGLAEAHRNGIVHRDVKPRNLMLNPRGQLKILDFGIAKLQSAPEFTGEGATLGTLHYLSPEQIGDKKVDQRSDIFSAGIVLYEMISGRRPFTGSASPAILNAILNLEPPVLSEYRPDLPTEIEVAINKALQKEPMRRFQRIDRLAEVFAAFSSRTAMSPVPMLRAHVTPDSGEDTDTGTRQWIGLLAVELLPADFSVSAAEKTLKIHRSDAKIVNEVVAAFEGEPIESRHNVWCFKFATATTAARCALAIARRFDQEQAEVTAGGDIVVRMSLEMGEMVEKANHALIEGLSVLKAILPFAIPGGAICSDNTRLMLGQPFEEVLMPLGEKTLSELGESAIVWQLKTSFENTGYRTTQKAAGKKPVQGNHELPLHKLMLTGAALVAAILILIWIWPASPTESPLPAKNQLFLTGADSAFVAGARVISAADSLQQFLAAGKNAGKWTYGNAEHFPDKEGKFILIITGTALERILQFDNGAYVDPVNGERISSLTPAYRGSIAVWAEIFEEAEE